MEPLAPGLLTMMKLCVVCLRVASAKERASASVPPPGWNGTTSSIGLVGKSDWAWAVPATKGTAARLANCRRVRTLDMSKVSSGGGVVVLGTQ